MRLNVDLWNNLSFSGFCCFSVKIKEGEKIDECKDLARELKKAIGHKIDFDTNLYTLERC